MKGTYLVLKIAQSERFMKSKNKISSTTPVCDLFFILIYSDIQMILFSILHFMVVCSIIHYIYTDFEFAYRFAVTTTIHRCSVRFYAVE